MSRLKTGIVFLHNYVLVHDFFKYFKLLNFVFILQIKISCREGEKLCRLQINPNRSQKEKKRDKRCCRKNQRMCKKKAKKRCKSRKKCLIRRYRRCRKKNSRCNKRKSTNRRPGKCETPRKKNSNEKKSFSYPTTVTESSTVAPKSESI